jgi:glutathione synthase
VLLNKEAGHLVRTKTSSSNEGGVAAGFAVLDSPYLVEAGELASFRILEHAA